MHFLDILDSSEFIRNMAFGLISLSISILAIVDKLASHYLGLTFFKVSKEAVLEGLSAEALAESERPEIKIPLEHTIECLSKAHRLDAFGRISQIQMLRNLLINRAEVTKALRDYPGIVKTPIKRPLFIVGFPRTGTTMLHHLLDQDPQFRSPMLWEMVHPAPPGRPTNWQDCDRYKKAKWMFDIYRNTNSCADNIHEIRAENPEECHFILDKNFFGIQNMVRFENQEALTNWFFGLSHEEVVEIYERYKTQLQMINLGADMEKHRLLLKGNIHLRSLDALLEVFPDAQIIFTYRPLSQVMPSMASMLEHLTLGWGKRDAYYGQRCTRLLGEMGSRTVRTMAKYDHLPQEKHPFHAVAYADLTKDPIATVRAIYEHFQIELTPKAESRMRTWIEDHPKDRNGRHHYTMSEYGITDSFIKGCFRDYLHYFKDKTPHKLL